MARSFNGTSDYIDLSVGGSSSIAAPFTLMAIVRRAATGTAAFASLNSGSTRRSEFKFNGPNQLQWTLPGVNDAPITSIVVNDTNWAVVGISKASGSVAPRGHRYAYSSSTWTHANSGTSVGNPTAGTSFRIGAIGTPADYFNGDIAVVGFWNRVLSDAETETLTASLSDWLALSPTSLFALNQASTATAVTDSTGGGASQTAISGTTVAAGDPPGFSYSLSSTYSASGTSAASAASSLAVTALLSASGSAAATVNTSLTATSRLASAGTAAASAASSMAATSLLPASGVAAATATTSLAVGQFASGTAACASTASLAVGLASPAEGVTDAVSATALSAEVQPGDSFVAAGVAAAVTIVSLAVGVRAQVSGVCDSTSACALTVTAILPASGSTAAATAVSLTLVGGSVSGTAAATSATTLTVTSILPAVGVAAAVSSVSLILAGDTRDLTFSGALGEPGWSCTLGVSSWTGQIGDPVLISVLSREFIPARLVSRPANGSAGVPFNLQPVHLALVTAGGTPQLSDFHPAEWVGAAGLIRWCRILVGPGVLPYAAGVYDVFARVEDISETPIRKINGQVTFQ